MPKIKARAGRLKDSKSFYSFKAKEKFKDIVKPRKILKEKSFQFLKQPTEMINNTYTTVVGKRLIKFFAHPQGPVIPVVKEFYFNMTKQPRKIPVVKECNIFMRQVQVPFRLSSH